MTLPESCPDLNIPPKNKIIVVRRVSPQNLQKLLPTRLSPEDLPLGDLATGV